MSNCEGCGAPLKLHLRACEYCQREHNQKEQLIPPKVVWTNGDQVLYDQQIKATIWDSEHASMGQHSEALWPGVKAFYSFGYTDPRADLRVMPVDENGVNKLVRY